MREENNFSKNIPVNGYAYGSYCSAHIAAISHCLWLILQCRRHGFGPWVGKIPWRKEWLPTPVFLPGISHGQRSLAGYSLWGRTELDMTNTFTFHFTELLNSVLVIIKNVTLWILSSSQWVWSSQFMEPKWSNEDNGNWKSWESAC